MYNELTQNDIKRLEEEIEYRKLVVRKKAIEDVKEARAHGDLSENFEYYAAKKAKNQNESRIRYLERMVKTSRIIQEEIHEGVVGVNCNVALYFEEDEEIETYKIVTTVRVDSVHGKISVESPIGKAVLGHKVGDRVFVSMMQSSDKIENNSVVNQQHQIPIGYYVVIKGIDYTDKDNDDRICQY